MLSGQSSGMKIFALTVLIASLSSPTSSLCINDFRERFTYRLVNGPLFWGLRDRECYGKSQSPIEINSTDAEDDVNLEPLSLNNYNIPISNATIENNGHTIEVLPADDIDRTMVVNGDVYSLDQFHFHWGNNASEGSEHILDGKQYAMEMHLVHFNEDENIAVLGIFFEEQENNNTELQKIVNELSNLIYKENEKELSSPLTLSNLLPDLTSYYRYYGSLTTPPCSEGVIWTVVPDPIPVGEAQMEEFRKLSSAPERYATSGCRLAGNYRPVQRLNDRKVFRFNSLNQNL